MATIHKENAQLSLILSGLLGFNVREGFPRYRDVFIGADDTNIKGDFYVYTRMGAGNSSCWGESYFNKETNECDCPAHIADRLKAKDFIVGRYNDSFDNTYCTFVVKLSPELKKEWGAIQKGNIPDTFKKRIKKLQDEVKAKQEAK